MWKPYDIEKLEDKYLDFITKIFIENLEFIKNRFLQRIELYGSWKNKLKRETKRTTDMGIGAERIMHHIIARNHGKCLSPVSIPVGSNLFYEASDAFVHIDVKTVYIENAIDYMGLIVVGDAQTSYPMKNKWGAPKRFDIKLPASYDMEGGEKKLCLTYAIQIIHVDIDTINEGKMDPNMVAVVIASIPNGLLYKIYREDVCGGEPKSFHYEKKRKVRPANFRHTYHGKPLFEVLKSKGIESYRVRIFFNKKYQGKRFEVQTSKYGRWEEVEISPELITQISDEKILSRIRSYI